LRQHVPLRARIENPENSFEYSPGRNRFATYSTRGNILLRKVFPNTVPMLVA
jgi:hypothetical protein